MNGVGVLAGAMHRHEGPGLIDAEPETLAYLVVHGAETLVKNPATPTLLVIGRNRHRMIVIDGEGLRLIVVVEALDSDDEPLGAILVSQSERPAWLAPGLRDDALENVEG